MELELPLDPLPTYSAMSWISNLPSFGPEHRIICCITWRMSSSNTTLLHTSCSYDGENHRRRLTVLTVSPPSSVFNQPKSFAYLIYFGSETMIDLLFFLAPTLSGTGGRWGGWSLRRPSPSGWKWLKCTLTGGSRRLACLRQHGAPWGMTSVTSINPNKAIQHPSSCTSNNHTIDQKQTVYYKNST